jgi:hypothetical protein
VAERIGTIILSAIVAHTAWHWMLDRGSVLRQFRFGWPALDAALLALVFRWLVLFMVLAGLLWLVRMASQKWAGRTEAARRRADARVTNPNLTPVEPAAALDSRASLRSP